jgi:uncharacterized protein YgbK (DUF1537 family)
VEGTPGCLRLIADDLTGALDAAVQFVRPAAPIDVFWRPTAATGSVAIDAGTRELDAETAARSVADQVAAFSARSDACHFVKLDSLLRGHAATEIRAWHEAMAFTHCLVAPAFPLQRRVTRGGHQYYRDGDTWRPTACDLAAELRRAGFAVTLCRPGESAPPGLSLWNAETDADLRAVAAAGRAVAGPVLWCGSGGLAGALGSGRSAAAAQGALPRPLLGLFGTDHPVTVGQLAACEAPVLSLSDGGAASATRIERQLAAEGVALAQVALPEGTDRADAARCIDREFAALLGRLASPATLLVSGGETLRAVCVALAADHLELVGQRLPGVPRSTLRGGRFDGVCVVSKSGAFGTDDTLRRLLAPRFTSAPGFTPAQGIPT